jgi:hypothetical protein
MLLFGAILAGEAIRQGDDGAAPAFIADACIIASALFFLVAK